MTTGALAKPTWIVACLLALLAVPALAAPARAADDSTLEDLLIEKGFITEAELDEARREAGVADADEPDDTVSVFEAEEEEEPKVDVQVGPKGLIVTSPDGAFVFGLGGRLQIDAGGFSGGITPEGAGARLRRGRIVTFGTLFDDWDYKFEVNFDGDGTVFPTDAWLRYSGCEPFTITVGHQKVPFSQSSMTSSNWQVFQERALNDGLIDTSEEGRRRLGAVAQSYGRDLVNWNLAVGVFGEGLTDPGSMDEDWGTAGRLVLAPFAEARKVVAVGGAVYYRQFKSASMLRYRSQPESSLANTRLVDTGVLANAADTLAYNADASLVLGAFHAQGEYTRTTVSRNFAPDVTFDGWYAQAGYFLTGESRNFDMKSAKYKRIKPKRKIGAWEIAARYSTLDLQDLDILGGRESNVTAGLNWWVNQSVMFRFNYVRADLSPTSTQVAIGGGLNQQVNAFMGRAQVVF